jgi:O-antigen/teichoic acid export membrane protein
MRRFPKLSIAKKYASMDETNTIDIPNAVKRNRRIYSSVFSTLISKVISLVVPIITVKITLNYLGQDTYGLWMSISSVFVMLSFADLGLGSGLQTKISQLSGLENTREIRKYVSSTFVVLLSSTLIIGLLFVTLFRYVNWSQIVAVNISDERSSLVPGVIVAIVISRLLYIPFGLTSRTQLALQEGFQNGLWQSASSLFGLLTTYVAIYLDVGPVALIWIISISSIIVLMANSIVLFVFSHKDISPSIDTIDIAAIKDIMKQGLGFLALSVLTTIGLSIDSFIVARTSSLSDVTIFSISQRTTQVLSITSAVICLPLWAANGEAISRNDFKWVKMNTKRSAIISLIISVIVSVVFILLSKVMFRLWLGDQFHISYILLSGLLMLQIIQSFISPYFMVLNGAGKVRTQVVIFMIFTPIALVIKYLVAYYYGMSYISWVGSIIYLLIVCFPIYIYSRRVYIRNGEGT